MRFLGLVAVVGCAAHVSPEQVSAVVALQGDPVHGAKVYEAQCQECHKAEGRGKGADLPALVPEAKGPELTEIVLTGPSIMPNFVHELEPQDVADVVAYLKDHWGG